MQLLCKQGGERQPLVDPLGPSVNPGGDGHVDIGQARRTAQSGVKPLKAASGGRSVAQNRS